EPRDMAHALLRWGSAKPPASSRSSSSDRRDGRNRLRLLCCHGCGRCALFAGNRGISDRSGPQHYGPQFLRGSASDVSTIHTGAKPLEVHHRVLAPDGCGFTDAHTGPAMRLQVAVLAPSTSHEISVGKVRAWLDNSGRSPAQQALKMRLRVCWAGPGPRGAEMPSGWKNGTARAGSVPLTRI